MRFPINCAKNGTPFELITGPYGSEFAVGMVTSLISPVAGSQPANHVPLLHGEPERALLVEQWRAKGFAGMEPKLSHVKTLPSRGTITGPSLDPSERSLHRYRTRVAIRSDSRETLWTLRESRLW